MKKRIGRESLKRRKENLQEDFMYYTWLFFLTAIFGWLWEGALYLFKDESYVNRGFLMGPWLPIYGMGAVLLEILFHKWRNRPGMVFFFSMLFCTLLEYAAGWYLESAWGVKWWDYSEMPFHLHGRICLLSSVLFGVGGMLLVWAVSPLFFALYRRVPTKLKVGLGLLAIVGGKMILPPHGKEFLHSTVSSFLHCTVTSFLHGTVSTFIHGAVMSFLHSCMW